MKSRLDLNKGHKTYIVKAWLESPVNFATLWSCLSHLLPKCTISQLAMNVRSKIWI